MAAVEEELGGAGTDDISVVHQTLRREVNERIRELGRHGNREEPQTLEVVCECAYVACTGQLLMNASDYEAVRRFPTRFVVKAGHDVTEFERIVGETDTYVVVEKVGSGGSFAVARDPRRRRSAAAGGSS